MSACHSLRSHLQLKNVFGKLGDTYQAYWYTYKTHALATCHGGWGQPLDRDFDLTREVHETTDTDIENTQDLHPVNTDHFEDLQHNNPMKLTALSREVDDLCQWVQAGERQPMETLNCIECKLQRLPISLNPPAPTEPLGKVIRHYRSTLCSAQKPTNLTNSLLQDISIQWTWYHTTKGLTSRYGDCSWPYCWKQNHTCSSKVKRFNTNFNHRSYDIRQILGWYQGFIAIKNL